MGFKFPDAEEELRRLLKEKERIEREFEELLKLRREGTISEEEFSERKYRLEREFVEVMDRIVQLRFILSQC